MGPRDVHAPVAQLDRASDYESEGRTFESFRARHFSFLTFVGLPERLSRAAGRKHGGDSRAKSARGFSKFDLLFFLHIKF